jgi:glycosyltransferase involved in cell wall biosynthesis
VNVALFHHLPLGGGAIRVLAEYVRRADHDFTLYTRRTETRGLLELDGKLKVVRRPVAPATSDVGRIRELWALPGRGRELAAEIDAGGHDVAFCHVSDIVQAPEVLPWLRTPTLYYAPETMRAHAEPEPEFGRVHTLKARLTRAGLNPYERKRVRLNDRDIQGADRVVTHSRFTASELRRVHGIEADVVPLGVDATDFTPGPVARERSVLAVGALHPLKGHQFLIDAVAAMPAPRPVLIVVGDRGHLEEPLRRHAAERGVALDLRQGIPFPELVDLYRRAGVVACGQIREPFGLITLEGMATRAPVVAVDEGGFRETVRDGVTGLLAPRDPAAFAQALASVLDDPALAERLGAAGREEVERVWTWERTAAGYDALLAELAASRAA